MNRYVHEVAVMDNRRARLLRVLSVAGITALVLAALWSAGVSATLWSALTTKHTEVIQPQQVVAQPSAISAPVVARSDPTAAGGNSSLAPTPQPLLLIGTSPGKNKHEGTARIGTNAEAPQTYVAGAVLVNGARLVEIHADHVVLVRGSERLQLFLSGEKMRAVGSTQLGMVGGTLQTPPRATIVLAKDHLTDVIRSMPYYQGEQLTGLQVFPGQYAHAFSQLGLRAGDIVTAIEGSPVAEQAATTEMLKTLTEGAAVTVSVRRGSESLVLSLDGSVVVKAVAKPDPATLTAGPAAF